MELIVSIALLLGCLAGIVTSLALLWTKVLSPAIRTLRRIGEVVDVMADLPEWQKQVDSNLKELKPNGGGSIKDEITEIKTMMEDHLKGHL